MKVIIESREERLRAVEVLVRLDELPNSSKEEAKVVFKTRLITCVTTLLKLKARRCVFDQRLIYIIGAILKSTESSENHRELVVESSFECVISGGFKVEGRRAPNSVSNECPWEAGETVRREIKPADRVNAVGCWKKHCEKVRKLKAFCDMPKIWQVAKDSWRETRRRNVVNEPCARIACGDTPQQQTTDSFEGSKNSLPGCSRYLPKFWHVGKSP